MDEATPEALVAEADVYAASTTIALASHTRQYQTSYLLAKIVFWLMYIALK